MNCFFFGTVIRTFMVYMLKSCDWPGDETKLSQWIKLFPSKQGNTSFQQRLREVHTLYMYMLFNCPLLTSGCPSLKIRWMTKQAFHPTMWERRKGNCFITFQNELHPLSLHVAIRVPGTTRQETQQVVTILINLCHTQPIPTIKPATLWESWKRYWVSLTSDVFLFGRGFSGVQSFTESFVLWENNSPIINKHALIWPVSLAS